MLTRSPTGRVHFDTFFLGFGASLFKRLMAESGIEEVQNPALPYICRFRFFSRLMWPSAGPLLHTDSTAFLTAAQSSFSCITNRTSTLMPGVSASSIQRCKLAALPPQRILRKLSNK